MELWDKIRDDFETSDATPKELAEKYGVKVTTLRSRKSREHWQRSGDAPPATKKPRNVATRNENVALQRNAVAAADMVESSELNDRQKLFCLYYLQRYNASWAYQKVYSCDYDTARTNGSRLLANANVKKVLAELKKRQQVDLYLTADDILAGYAKQAFSSMGDVLDYNVQKELVTDNEGNVELDTNDNPISRHIADIYLKPSEEIDWSLVQEIHRGREGLVVKLYDKQKAMRELIDRLPESKRDDGVRDGFLGAIVNRSKKSDGIDDNKKE